MLHQAIGLGIVATCRAPGTEVIATGVENAAESNWLERSVIQSAQGLHFGAPRVRSQRTRRQAPLLQAAMAFI